MRGDSGVPVKLMGVPDYFVEHGDVKEQLCEVGLTVENIVQNAHQMITVHRQRV